MESLRNKRALVTGAPGFIGSHVVRRLVAAGAEVHALTNTVSSMVPPRLLDLRGAIKLHEANLTDRSAMDTLVARCNPEYVFHLAAYTHVGKSWTRVDECVQTNVQGTVNLLQALDGRYQRFVYTSTSEVYGDVGVPFKEDAPVHPVSPYAVSKYSGELFCRMFHQSLGWPIVILRPFNAYGPWQTSDRVIPEIIAKALQGKELQMTEGRQTREFNYVDDLARAFLLAATANGVDGEVLNVGCGLEVSMRDLATTILDLMGNPVKPRFGALPHRPAEIWRMYCDNSKAVQKLGWKPEFDLTRGLARTIEWYTAELARPDSPFAP